MFLISHSFSLSFLTTMTKIGAKGMTFKYLSFMVDVECAESRHTLKNMYKIHIRLLHCDFCTAKLGVDSCVELRGTLRSCAVACYLAGSVIQRCFL